MTPPVEMSAQLKESNIRGNCMWPALLSLVVSFVIICISWWESVQAGGRVNFGDLHILVLYYHRG